MMLEKGERKAVQVGKVPVCFANEFGHCPVMENTGGF